MPSGREPRVATCRVAAARKKTESKPAARDRIAVEVVDAIPALQGLRLIWERAR